MAVTAKIRDEQELRGLRAKIVGRHFQKIRAQAGLTQIEMARALSYSTAQFVSNWERGVCLPPQDVLSKVAKTCGVPATELVDVLYQYQERALKVEKKGLLAYLQKRTPLRGRSRVKH